MSLDRQRIAEVLQAYEVGEELGRGGWGIVLAGRHRHLGRHVAIKQLPAAFGADPHVQARFLAEARLIASLDHPHIVPVFDYVEREGLYLIVMEYLPGGTLWERFTSQGVASDQAVAMLLAVCTALQFAHERGILHRDVKPENLMFSAQGVIKLTDFGIARVLTESDVARTATGVVLGTPAYMAPERALGQELAPPSDVYSAAVLLYELLCGHLPFPEASDAISQVYQHVHEPPRPLTTVAPTVPPELGDVVMEALAKAPEDRYESAEAFGLALAEAATAAWEPGWLRRSGVSLMGAGAIAAATEQAPRRRRRGRAPTTVMVAEVRRHKRLGAAVAPGPTPAPPEETAAEVVGHQAAAPTTARETRVAQATPAPVSPPPAPVSPPPAPVSPPPAPVSAPPTAVRRSPAPLTTAAPPAGTEAPAAAVGAEAPEAPPPVDRSAPPTQRPVPSPLRPPLRPPPPARRRRARVALMAGGVVAVVGAVLAFVLLGGGDETSNEPEPTEAADTAAPTTPSTPTTAATSPPARATGARQLDWVVVVQEVFTGPGDQVINGVAAVPTGVAEAGGSQYLAVGSDGRGGDLDAAVWASNDGTVWDRVSDDGLEAPADQELTGLSGFGDKVVATGSDTSGGDLDAAVWVSSDGLEWQRVSDPDLGGPGDQVINRLRTAPPGVIAVGSDTSGGDLDAAVWVSSDGLEWQRVSDPDLGGPGDQVMNRVNLVEEPAPGGPTMVAVGFQESVSGADAAVWASRDGQDWQRIADGADVFGGQGDQRMFDVVGFGPELIAVGLDSGGGDEDGAMWTSADGLAWERLDVDEGVLGGAGDQAITRIVAPDSAAASGLPAIIAAGYDRSGGDADAVVWTSEDGRTVVLEVAFRQAGDQEISGLAARLVPLIAAGSDRSGGDADGAIWTARP